MHGSNTLTYHKPAEEVSPDVGLNHSTSASALSTATVRHRTKDILDIENNNEQMVDVLPINEV